ncbi:MAG: penicillin-binding protein 1C [Bradymonadaceae bacterium]|nr:penicillin-binding protein 1C [Lujinxingiaceae bacterium]
MNRRLRWSLGGLLLCVLSLLVVLVCAWFAPLPKRLSERDSVVVEYHDKTPAHVFLSADDKWRITRQLDEIDPAYLAALVAFEDKRFYSHRGVDLRAIGRAVWGNMRHARVTSGASTITMQLARLLEPRPRTLRSKLVEAFRATQLELHLSKDEILEAYLRFLPFGRNVEGIEAAALGYFGHSAANLSSSEIATLLAVPQSPNARYPSAPNVDRLARARDKIARRLTEIDVFEPGATAQITASLTPSALRPFARDVPHAAIWLRALNPRSARIHTTLDAGAQRTAELALARYEHDAKRLGVANAAIVVLDHRQALVRALVGNFDFSLGAGAQIPGFAAPRSPGSILKPFIYAAAIDDGLALPGFLVEDTPYESGSYRPANYSNTFMGLVSLEESLSLSLNIPFVRLLSAVGVENFAGQLRHMGAAGLRDEPGHYGLSLAVGACEVSALEVAGFYATLARGGRYQSAAILTKDAGADSDGLTIYSEGAAWLANHALALRDRPDFPTRRHMGPAGLEIYWKTGTSFGHRDAWTAGFMGDYTAVVWMGNLDNRSNAALIGSERAAPVFFDVLEGLNRRQNPLSKTRARPSDLTRVEVCAYSGHLPTPACDHTKHVDALRRAVPTRRCPYHVRHDVDDATGLLLNSMCRANRPHHSQSYVVWPPGVRRFLSAQSRANTAMPDYAPGCLPPAAHHAPRITSPPPSQTLILIPGVDLERQKVRFEADTATGAALSWFVDGEFLGRMAPEQQLWWTPRIGRHEIVVMEDSGLATSREFEVSAFAHPNR